MDSDIQQTNFREIAHQFMYLFMKLELLLDRDPQTNGSRRIQLDTGDEIPLRADRRFLTQACLFLTNIFIHSPGFSGKTDADAVWKSLLSEVTDSRNEDLLDEFDKFVDVWNASMAGSKDNPEMTMRSMAISALSKVLAEMYFDRSLARSHGEIAGKFLDVLDLYYSSLIDYWRGYESTGQWEIPKWENRIDQMFTPYDLNPLGQ